MRLFIAVNFNAEMKNALLESIDRLKECSAGGNFTREENLHLTLVFIGETGRTEAVERAMDKISFNSFELKLSKLGKFSRSGGDIYWVGVDKSRELTSIYTQLTQVLGNAGFKTEKRSYTPHITLGREVVLQKMPELTMMKSAMTVNKISLMKSERTGGKLTYTEIYAKYCRA